MDGVVVIDVAVVVVVYGVVMVVDGMVVVVDGVVVVCRWSVGGLSDSGCRVVVYWVVVVFCQSVFCFHISTHRY